MEKVKIIVVRPFYVDKKIVEKGTELEVSKSFASEMLSSNKAILAPPVAPAIPPPEIIKEEGIGERLGTEESEKKPKKISKANF